MRPRWRKVVNDLWTYRVRSLLVVASIATGLFALGTIATIHFIVSEDMRIGYAASSPANIHMVTTLFDQRMVDRIQNLPGVLQAEGERNFSLRLQTLPGEWLTINIRSVPNWSESYLNQIRPVEGSWPPDERELVIEQYKFPETNAELGEYALLELPGSQLRRLKVTGIASEQTLGAFDIGPGFFLAPAQGYVTQDTIAWLGQSYPGMFNTLNVTVNEETQDEESLLAFADYLSTELEKGGIDTFRFAVRGSYDHPNRIFTDAIAALLIILGFLVVFLSAFLITNTLQALIAQQVSQIGIMKTVGARRRQVAGIYTALIFLFSILSIAVALPSSNQVAFRAAEYLADQINFVFQGKRAIPPASALLVIVGVVIPQIAALIPIWRGVQLSIQEAVSGILQDQLLYQDPLSRFLTRLSGFSRPTLVSLRNTFRRKGRLVLTLVTLALGGAVFIATFNVRNSMANFVVQVSRYFLGDINLTLQRPYRIEEVSQILSKIPEIESFEAWGGARAEMYQDGQAGESVQMLAPPSDSRLVMPVMLSGRWIEQGDENAIVLNERFLSSYPSIQIGDTLRLRVNGKQTDWRVVGFFRLAGKRTGLMAYTGFDYLSHLTGTTNQASVYRIVAENKDLTELDQKALGRDIETVLRRAGINVSEVTAGSWLSSAAAEGFSVLTAFLLFLSILTALVGSIGLAGTMSMNVFERTREIGILRAIGASNPVLMRMILSEGMIIGVLSWLVAIFLAWPISLLLYNSVSVAIFGVVSELNPTPLGFVIWLIFVILLSLIASFIPARNAANLTIREVLAYE